MDAISEPMPAEESAEQKLDRLSPSYQIWCQIKKSSKYYSQGLNAEKKPLRFPVTFDIGGDGYCVRTPFNRYRLEDVQLFARINNLFLKISRV